ncbi:MAG: major facilitator superfamily-domain-containing protein [Benjaminiella poitrasii]|nr:MAG: major facilitator superfamily-domain-containing protein [Benjaminiella poitrasii]
MFQANNISGVLSTVLSILQTALQPIYSKMSNIVGRAEAYTISIILFVISYVIMAVAQNYNTLIGGQVIYAFGYSGTYVLGPILIGDMTGLVNRSFFLALYNFPTIINLFAASVAAQKFVNHGQWRWAFGHISIVVFLTSAPLIYGLWRVQRRAKKVIGVRPHINRGSFLSRTRWLFSKIDFIGSLLLVAGLFLILLPLLMVNSWGGWHSAKVIGTLVAGGVSWILFAIWEWKFSVTPIVPVTHWESKNPVWGVLFISIINAINFMMDYQYFLTYLEVTRRVNSQTATYLERGFNVTYVTVPLFLGYLMKRTRRWRPYAWVGASCAVLGPGLMIPARHPSSPDAFVVIAQVIFGLAEAFSNYPILVGIQGSVPKNDVAIVIALYEVGSSVASSIGTTIAGSVWNSVLPNLFKKYVPGEYDYAKIVGNIKVATSLPADQYQGVVKAYDEAMHTLCIIAVCMGALAFLCSIPLKGFPLVDEDDNKVNDDVTATVVLGDHDEEKEAVNENVEIPTTAAAAGEKTK